MLNSSKTVLHNPRLPIDLLLVRDGISEGTLARKFKMEGKLSYISEELATQHVSRWRLTEFGRLQAKSCGQWIKANFKKPFDAYLSGEFVRSLETAALLDLPDAKWIPSLFLRPRDFGIYSSLDKPVTQQEIERREIARNHDAFYWAPPGGESIAHLTLRTERVVQWIRHHVPSDGAAIVVAHRDVMETFRIRLEHISQMEYDEKIVRCPQQFKLNNGCILQYTRRNPKTGEVFPHYRWMRIVTPWLGKHFNDNTFTEFKIHQFNNEELFAEASQESRFFGD